MCRWQCTNIPFRDRDWRFHVATSHTLTHRLSHTHRLPLSTSSHSHNQLSLSSPIRPGPLGFWLCLVVELDGDRLEEADN